MRFLVDADSSANHGGTDSQLATKHDVRDIDWPAAPDDAIARHAQQPTVV